VPRLAVYFQGISHTWHAMLKPELQAIVDQLCEDGCKAVGHYIDEIESGSDPMPMKQLQPTDREQVLAELKSIMAVYDRSEK
jgi:hypothetical protein